MSAQEIAIASAPVSVEISAAMVQPYRDAFKAKHNRDTTLSHEALVKVLTSQAEGVEISADDWARIILEAEGKEKVDSGISAETPASRAFKMAETIVADARANTAIVAILKARETLKRGPVAMLLLFRADYGTDRLAMFPIVNSEAPVGNRPAAKYRKPQKNAKGINTTVPGDWYNDFADAFQVVRDIVRDLNDLGDKKGKFQGMSAYDRKAHQITLEGKRTAVRTLVKQAMSLHQQLETLEMYPAAKVRFSTDTVRADAVNDDNRHLVVSENSDGTFEMLGTNYNPIIVSHASKPENFEVMSVTSFLSLDVPKAREKGGTYDALIETVKGGETPENEEAAAWTQWGIGDFVTAMSGISEFLDDESHAAVVLKAIAEKDSADFVEAFGEFFISVQSVYNRHVKARFENIKKAQADKLAAEAAKQNAANK